MREVQQKLQVFRGGPVTLGLSAVDIALWDIVGKAAGLPLHRLLGGGVADLPCYASLDSFSDSELVRAGVRQALKAGFTSLKLHEQQLSAVHAAPRGGRSRRGDHARRELRPDAEPSPGAGGRAQRASPEVTRGAGVAA
jgi:L-alanine-DL-glutamate epimerase-like enolase superfamily enzyme